MRLINSSWTFIYSWSSTNWKLNVVLKRRKIVSTLFHRSTEKPEIKKKMKKIAKEKGDSITIYYKAMAFFFYKIIRIYKIYLSEILTTFSRVRTCVFSHMYIFKNYMYTYTQYMDSKRCDTHTYTHTVYLASIVYTWYISVPLVMSFGTMWKLPSRKNEFTPLLRQT